MSSVDLTNELRLAKPRAPEQLRERVLALSERPVREPRFSFSLPSRYTVAAASRSSRLPRWLPSPSAARSSMGSRTRVRRRTSRLLTRSASPARRTRLPRLRRGDVRASRPSAVRSFTGEGADAVAERASSEPEPPPALPGGDDRPRRRPRRAVAVDPEGDAHHARARRLRRLGASSDRAKQGTSALVVKIPIGHVQQAIARFSALGTIAAQNIQITDLQTRFNRVVKQIGARASRSPRSTTGSPIRRSRTRSECGWSSNAPGWPPGSRRSGRAARTPRTALRSPPSPLG